MNDRNETREDGIGCGGDLRGDQGRAGARSGVTVRDVVELFA